MKLETKSKIHALKRESGNTVYSWWNGRVYVYFVKVNNSPINVGEIVALAMVNMGSVLHQLERGDVYGLHDNSHRCRLHA